MKIIIIDFVEKLDFHRSKKMRGFIGASAIFASTLVSVHAEYYYEPEYDSYKMDHYRAHYVDEAPRHHYSLEHYPYANERTEDDIYRQP